MAQFQLITMSRRILCTAAAAMLIAALAACGSASKSSGNKKPQTNATLKQLPTIMCMYAKFGTCTEWVPSSEINGSILKAVCEGNDGVKAVENQNCPSVGAVGVCEWTKESFMADNYVKGTTYYYAPEFDKVARSEGLCTTDHGIFKEL